MNVGLTHSRHVLTGLKPKLEELGLSVQWQPLVETTTINDASTRELAARLLSCDWLVFPSRSAVRAWVQLGLATSPGPNGGAAPGPSSGAAHDVSLLRFAAVGLGTAEELGSAGLRPHLVGDGDAESTADALLEMTRPGDHVGLAQGDRARSTLAVALRSEGREVTAVPVYRTETTEWHGPPAKVTVLASPSAVEAFGRALLARTVPIAVGPVTAGAVRRMGSVPTMATAPYAPEVALAVMGAAREASLETVVS